MISADLEGKAVLVTGASSGIGRAAAGMFAANGARVALNYPPDDSRGPQVVEQLRGEGHDAYPAAGDVSMPGEAESAVAQAVEALGRLDILINNAGTANTVEPIPFEDLDAMTEDFWQRILSTNLIGPFRCARAAARYLKKARGAVVNTASISGLGVRGSSIAYGASKAGLINMTRSLAVALAPEVRVNAVAPGLVRTPWTAPWPEELKKRSIADSLLKRIVEPEHVASAMLFLSVHPAITGQTLVVDCGRRT